MKHNATLYAHKKLKNQKWSHAQSIQSINQEFTDYNKISCHVCVPVRNWQWSTAAALIGNTSSPHIYSHNSSSNTVETTTPCLSFTS